MKEDKKLVVNSGISQQLWEISIPQRNNEKIKILKPFLYAFLIALILTGCRNKEDAVVLTVTGKNETPSVILKDHHYFLNKLEPVTRYKDSTGYFAGELYKVMEYHFKEEEEYVLPPLGILPLMARGEFPVNANEIFLLTEKFRENSAVMLAEHQMITHFLAKMMRTAAMEDHKDLMGFEEEVQKHSALEEEVLFPMVFVIGDYLKLRQGEGGKE